MRLTRQEWTVLGLLAALLVVGWVVRQWRTVPAGAGPALPARAEPAGAGSGEDRL